MSHERSSEGYVILEVPAVLDRLLDVEPRFGGVTVLDLLTAARDLGCERAGAMLERERRRPTP